MIRGLHGLFYSSEPEATRAFIRDKLRLPCTDVGEGWLIFDLPEADMGVHPTDGKEVPAGTHNLSLYCDDIQATVAELKTRGVPFTGPVFDEDWGYVTHFTMPGGVEVQLYEPRYKKKREAQLKTDLGLVRRLGPKTKRNRRSSKPRLKRRA